MGAAALENDVFIDAFVSVDGVGTGRWPLARRPLASVGAGPGTGSHERWETGEIDVCPTASKRR